jgi:acyl-CoA synthetase (AMP-forming)/AMP-acid ligase II
LPGVAVCVVVGRPHADLGTAVHAVVAMQPGMPAMSLSELRDQLAGMISAYKLPRSLECIDEIARSDAGKVRRKSYRGDAA